MSEKRRRLGFFGRIYYWANVLFAILLLSSSLASHLDPRTSAYLAILGLFYPLWLVINIVFFIYWTVRVRPQFLLSFIVILLSWNDLSTLIRFGNQEKALNAEHGLRLMSYNVQMFNRYQWDERPEVSREFEKVVETENPDILCIQEFYRHQRSPGFSFSNRYEWTPNNYGRNYGLAIYSRFPIIDTGSIRYNPYVGLSNNKGFIWADILWNGDTLRVINVHLASLQLKDDDFRLVDGEVDISKQDELKQKVWKLGGRIGRALTKHGHQMEPLLKFIDDSPYSVVVLSDLNDTQSGYAYSSLSKRLNDSFVAAGRGFGRTYPRFWFPLRIDHIFISREVPIIEHKVIKTHISDHFPVVAELGRL